MTVHNPLVWIAAGYLSEVPPTDQVAFPNGAVGTPGITFRGSNSSGLYWTATQVNLSVAGSLVAAFSSTGLNVTGNAVASGNIQAVGGIFSGNISAVNGNFTGPIQEGGNTVVDTNRLVYLRAFTVATLPGSPADGATAFVSDSNQTMTAGIGTAVAGGGTNKVPVYAAGGTWLIG